MDNDIATVAEGALDVVKDLKQLDLTGITDFKITLHLWPHQKCIVCGVLYTSPHPDTIPSNAIQFYPQCYIQLRWRC